MVKTRSRVPLTSVFHKKSKNTSDENGVPEQIAIKTVEHAKRKRSERSPESEPRPSRKRSAFGDITNAALVHQGGNNIKKKQAKSGVVNVRKESQRQSKAKVSVKANPKQRQSQEEKDSADKPVVVEESPSGEILISQDSIEESSASSQDSLQSSSSGTSLDVTIPQSSTDSALSSLEASSSSQPDKDAKDDSKHEQDEGVESVVDDGVIDIDADNSDPVTVSEYAHEIFVNMKRRENLFPLTNYMETLTDITPQMRAILVDWLVEVQECFELYHETLYLGVKLLDHYLEKNSAEKDELQLIGATTLIISSKIEERHPPCMDDFIYICDDAYQQHQFIAMEGKIIRSLGFDINIPVPYRFLRRYAKAAFASIQTLTLARFLLESSLLESRFITYKASYMATSCLYLALLMNNCSEWTPTLVHYTGYTKDELRDCVLQLNSMNAAPPNKNLMTVRNKYSHAVFHEVAKIPALDALTIQI